MVIGIDYSLTSPAMCIMTEPTIDKCIFYYLTDNSRLVGTFKNAIGVHHKDYYSEQERYDNIAEFFLNKIPLDKGVPNIFIEDYSFGSKGKVFHIAENAGLLKYKFWEVGYKFETVPPTVVKKFGTGKGNADKAKMYEAFVNETREEFIMLFNKNLTLGSPVTDIVDSYYIAKYGYDKINQKGTV
jgi:hypothetical protein